MEKLHRSCPRSGCGDLDPEERAATGSVERHERAAMERHYLPRHGQAEPDTMCA
jgi:hypothetical protein